MATWEQLKEAPLGQRFHRSELENCCRAVYGAVAWPNKNPGFVVIIAVSRSLGTLGDYFEMCLLYEFESFDTRELVRACGRLDSEWEPDRWIGDTRNGAAEEFIWEMNEEAERQFELTPSFLLDVDGEGNRMDPMYPYILGTIKPLIEEKHRRLFLKDSKVVNYLSTIRPDEITSIEGTVPAIEAMGYAIDEALRDLKSQPITQTHTEDGPVVRNEGEFDHLLRPGATDPGPEYDDDEWDDEEQLRTC